METLGGKVSFPVENKHLKLRTAQAFSGSWTSNRHSADHKQLSLWIDMCW